MFKDSNPIIKKWLKPYLGLPKEVYVLFIARIVNAMGMFVFPMLTFLLKNKMGIDELKTGYIITLSSIIFTLSALIGGKLADSFGRKKLIIIFDTLAACCYIACAFIEPSIYMIVLILLAGFFMGITDPAHNSLIADITTPANRDGAFSLTYLGFNMGFAIGPAIGGILFKNHLKLFFMIDAITALIATSLVLFFIRETYGRTKENLSQDRHLEKSEDGSIFSVLLKRPLLIAFSVVAIGYNFVYAQWSFLIPLHVEHNFVNEGAKIYGLLSSFNGAIVMVFTAFITTLLLKHSNIRKIVFGGFFYLVGFGLLAFISTKIAFVLSVFILTIGEIIVTISFMPFLANHTPASHRGRMNAILPMVMGLGFTVAPIISGKLVSVTSYSNAWIIVSIVMVFSIVGMIFIDKKDRIHSKKLNTTDITA